MSHRVFSVWKLVDWLIEWTVLWKNVKLWEYFIKQATATFCLNITLHVIDASNCNCNCSVLSQQTNRVSLFLRNTSSILRCGSNIWLLWIYASINHHWYMITIIKGRLIYITHYTVTMLWWIIWGDQPAILSNFTPVTHCRVDASYLPVFYCVHDCHCSNLRAINFQSSLSHHFPVC